LAFNTVPIAVFVVFPISVLIFLVHFSVVTDINIAVLVFGDDALTVARIPRGGLASLTVLSPTDRSARSGFMSAPNRLVTLFGIEAA
jgi:hypothetical protein